MNASKKNVTHKITWMQTYIVLKFCSSVAKPWNNSKISVQLIIMWHESLQGEKNVLPHPVEWLGYN